MPAAGEKWPDIAWRTASGEPPDTVAWELPDGRLLACVITVGEAHQPARERVMLVQLGGATAVEVRLPDGEWHLQLDSARGWVAGETGPAPAPLASSLLVAPSTVLVLVQPLHPTHEACA